MKRKLFQSKMLIIIMAIFSSLILVKCDDKKFTNPWDENTNLNPDEWVPANFRIEKASSDTILLAWDYEGKNIEGFQIDRKLNNAEWQTPFVILPKEKRSFTDADFANNVGNTFNYKLSAFAGNNNSSGVLVDFTVGAPTVTTNQIINISDTSAICGGNVTFGGVSEVIGHGVCWSISQNPSITDLHTIDGSGTGNFASILTGLSENTLYNVRAYATNGIGTAYGANASFKTLTSGSGGTVTDIDGNVYTTVIIGTQIWLGENLKVTHYRNGDVLPNVTNGTQWNRLSTGAYCWYNNDEAAYKNVYGAYYNWFTVVDSRNLCPTGWHIPNDAEWTTLTNYLGGDSVAGDKMKETGTVHWLSPNTGATNECGFTGLPGGSRYGTGPFNDIGYSGNWWSSTAYEPHDAWFRYLLFNDGSVLKDWYNKGNGFSVRCVRD
jgi:uncharacterized protein (TIGR02145 family)